jgi:hypothetical protein
MAMISVEFDTVAKTMTASVDGVAIADAVEAAFYKSSYDGKGYACIVREANDKDAGIHTVTRLMARQELPTDQPSPSCPGLFERTSARVVDAISQWLCRRG